MERSREEEKQNQNENGKGKSCKGFLYYSSTIKSQDRNPRCIGIPRSLPQGTSYAVGQSEAETSRERRGLVGFHYACAGYSVYMSRNEGSVDKEEDKPELPACLGFEFVAYRRTPAAGPASASAHVHRRGDLMSFNFQQLNAEDRDIRQPRTHKPTHAVGDDFLHRQVYKECKPCCLRGSQEHA
ncbi:hypothetical protein QUC31_002844 [Theobroma cacao]